jgi:uncharacterized protein (TIGR02452 family)
MYNHLINIAKLNQKYIDTNSIVIPKTTEIKYGTVPIKPTPITSHTRVFFETFKTDDCAIHYLDTNMSDNVVIMNFASRRHPGGGYVNGARAQEEDLCRVMPQLYPSLKKLHYPYDKDSILLTPELSILRNSDNYNFLSSKSNYVVGVVSAAAQNLRHEIFDGNQIKRTLQNLYVSTKYYLPNTDTLILGAWGCGAFDNDPYVMSRIMNEINLEYGGLYETIVFSVPEGVNANEFRENIKLF